MFILNEIQWNVHVSQQRFRQWLGAIRHHVITWTCAESLTQFTKTYVSPGLNELMGYIPQPYYAAV